MAKRKGRRMLWTVGGTLLGAYVVWAGLLFVFQTKLIFPSSLAGSGTGVFAADLEVLTRTLPPGEGTGVVEAWLWPHPDATAESPRPLVVYFHGNAELIDYQAWHAGVYRDLGYSVLLVEYRGYGRSSGSPGEAAIVDDAMWFLDAMQGREGIDTDRVVVHGRSIGGSVAVQVAGQMDAAGRPPMALVLETSTPSIAGMAWRFGLPPVLARHPFRSDRVLPRLTMPVLVIAAEDDDVFPLHHSERLVELSQDPTFVKLRGQHNTFIEEAGPGVYREALRGFLSGVLERTTEITN